MKNLKLSFLTLAFIAGFNNSASANFVLNGLYVDSVMPNLVDVAGSSTSYIENGAAYNYAWFSPDFGDINYGTGFVREQVEAPSSGAYVTGVFSTLNISELTSNPTDSDSGFGISIVGSDTTTSLGVSGAQLGIFNSPLTNAPVIYFNDLTYGNALNGYDSLDGTLGDNIWLSFFTSAGSIYPSYSYDGTNFILLANWESTPTFGYYPGTLTATGALDATASAFGQTAVPLPPAFALFAAPAAILGLLSRRRKNGA